MSVRSLARSVRISTWLGLVFVTTVAVQLSECPSITVTPTMVMTTVGETVTAEVRIEESGPAPSATIRDLEIESQNERVSTASFQDVFNEGQTGTLVVRCHRVGTTTIRISFDAVFGPLGTVVLDVECKEPEGDGDGTGGGVPALEEILENVYDASLTLDSTTCPEAIATGIMIPDQQIFSRDGDLHTDLGALFSGPVQNDGSYEAEGTTPIGHLSGTMMGNWTNNRSGQPTFQGTTEFSYDRVPCNSRYTTTLAPSGPFDGMNVDVPDPSELNGSFASMGYLVANSCPGQAIETMNPSTSFETFRSAGGTFLRVESDTDVVGPVDTPEYEGGGLWNGDGGRVDGDRRTSETISGRATRSDVTRMEGFQGSVQLESSREIICASAYVARFQKN